MTLLRIREFFFMKNALEILEIADIHEKRIVTALKKLHQLFPIDASKLQVLDEDNLVWIDFLINRFGKLQDLIGSKLIDIFLDLYKEPSLQATMLEKLSKLERLGILSLDTWVKMRDARNHVSHEYPNEPSLTAFYLNQVVELTPQLLSLYHKLRQKISAIQKSDGLDK